MSIHHAILFLLFPTILLAREAQPAPTPTKFQVLQRKVVNAGDHSIIFNRVAPPPIPANSLKAAAPVSAVPAEQLRESDVPEKPTIGLSLSATVYDREVTLLRWFHDGREYRAFSNIDFNYIAGLSSFETAGTLYSFVMGLGNATREQAQIDRANAIAHGAPEGTHPRLPLVSELDASRAQYRFAEGSPVPPTELLAALDALHRHFDANRATLIAQYHQRIANQAERERLLRENPPKRKDSVINYWPKKSTLFPSRSN